MRLNTVAFFLIATIRSNVPHASAFHEQGEELPKANSHAPLARSNRCRRREHERENQKAARELEEKALFETARNSEVFFCSFLFSCFFSLLFPEEDRARSLSAQGSGDLRYFRIWKARPLIISARALGLNRHDLGVHACTGTPHGPGHRCEGSPPVAPGLADAPAVFF